MVDTNAGRGFVLLLTITLNSAMASSDSFASNSSPAWFSGGPSALEGANEFPRVDEDIQFRMLCDMDVGEDGNIIDRLCHVGERRGARTFQSAIYQALRQVEVIPASSEGRPQRVWMQFSVVFARDRAHQRIRVNLNHGHDASRYGLDYISPQRLQRHDDIVFMRCTSPTFVWVRTIVDESGVPAESIDVIGRGTKRCKRYMKIRFAQERFIPAIHNGEFVKSIYAEPFFNVEPW